MRVAQQTSNPASRPRSSSVLAEIELLDESTVAPHLTSARARAGAIHLGAHSAALALFRAERANGNSRHELHEFPGFKKRSFATAPGWEESNCPGSQRGNACVASLISVAMPVIPTTTGNPGLPANAVGQRGKGQWQRKKRKLGRLPSNARRSSLHCLASALVSKQREIRFEWASWRPQNIC